MKEASKRFPKENVWVDILGFGEMPIRTKCFYRTYFIEDESWWKPTRRSVMRGRRGGIIRPMYIFTFFERLDTVLDRMERIVREHNMKRYTVIILARTIYRTFGDYTQTFGGYIGVAPFPPGRY